MKRAGILRTSRWLLAVVAAAAPLVASADVGNEPRIALIIDDLGYRWNEGLRATRLPGAVTVAILPHTAHTVALAREANDRGKEILLHLPMQPIEPDEQPGPGALDVYQTRTEFEAVLADDLASVPFVRGVNNHMGSLLTRQLGAMHWLMEDLRERGSLYFLDSFTTPASVGLEVAREEGVPALRRDVFLDPDREPAAIASQWNRLLGRAKLNGFAVGIGHPYPATLDLLERVLPSVGADGVVLVPLSALMPKRRAAP